jgi:hypothetical protein
VLNVLGVLELLVVDSRNVFHTHAVALSMSQLVNHKLVGWRTQRGQGGIMQPPSTPRPSGAAYEQGRSKVLRIFLTLLQKSEGLPASAREALLAHRAADCLLEPLRAKLEEAPADAALVAEAMGGILASGDETAHELAVTEGPAARRCRVLPSAATPQGDEEVEPGGEVEEEVLLQAVERWSPHQWADMVREERWGPWRATHWVEALYGALEDADQGWSLRILAGGDRWRAIRRQPCFISRRGPWRGTLKGRLPATALDALAVLRADELATEQMRRAYSEMQAGLRRLDAIMAGREAEQKQEGGPQAWPELSPRGGSSGIPVTRDDTQRGVLYEQANRCMLLVETEPDVVGSTAGFLPGDRVRSRRHLSSFGTVVGLAQGRLWVHWDEDAGAAFRDDNYAYTELELVRRDEAGPPGRARSALVGGWVGLWPVFSSLHLLEVDDDLEVSYQQVREGSRVTRGPSWRRGCDGAWASSFRVFAGLVAAC